jgi:hypothetical protein
LWTVEAVRWEFRKHETEQERLLAEKGEEKAQACSWDNGSPEPMLRIANRPRDRPSLP